jgi:hypothetical protein
VETNFSLRKDRSTHSISIISMELPDQKNQVLNIFHRKYVTKKKFLYLFIFLVPVARKILITVLRFCCLKTSWSNRSSIIWVTPMFLFHFQFNFLVVGFIKPRSNEDESWREMTRVATLARVWPPTLARVLTTSTLNWFKFNQSWWGFSQRDSRSRFDHINFELVQI